MWYLLSCYYCNVNNQVKNGERTSYSPSPLPSPPSNRTQPINLTNPCNHLVAALFQQFLCLPYSHLHNDPNHFYHRHYHHHHERLYSALNCIHFQYLKPLFDSTQKEQPRQGNGFKLSHFIHCLVHCKILKER